MGRIILHLRGIIGQAQTMVMAVVMNPCNGMVSPPVPKTPGNHGRYRHIHLGAYVLAHHVS